jgi:hypothetical protein
MQPVKYVPKILAGKSQGTEKLREESVILYLILREFEDAAAIQRAQVRF